jgi:hypothetical protein
VLLIYTKERKRHVRDAALNDARTIAPIHSGVIVQGPAFIAIRYWMMGMHTPRHLSCVPLRPAISRGCGVFEIVGGNVVIWGSAWVMAR